MGLVEHYDHWELSLAGMPVTQLVIDFQFSIHFSSKTEHWQIIFGSNFVFRRANNGLTIIPGDMASVRPALDLFGKTAASASAFKDGRLEILFDDGTCVDASPARDYEAWELHCGNGQMIVCMPDGKLAVWSAPAPPSDS